LHIVSAYFPFGGGRLSNSRQARSRMTPPQRAIDLSFHKCVGIQCNSQGCVGVAPANCESFLHLSFDRIGGGRGSVCATGHCFGAIFRSELTEGGGRTPGVTAIRAFRMRKDQLQVGHTIHPSDSGRRGWRACPALALVWIGVGAGVENHFILVRDHEFIAPVRCTASGGNAPSRQCLHDGTARQCWTRHAGHPKRCGSYPQPNSACGLPAGCPSRSAQTRIQRAPISVSSPLLDGYDEPEILCSSTPKSVSQALIRHTPEGRLIISC
jgi:hypothetical protein